MKLTPEELKKVREHLQAAYKMNANERETFLAETINDVYDVEMPIDADLSPIVDYRKAAIGEHVYYMVPTTIDKKVNIITSGCAITQQQVHPNDRTELTFTSMLSPEFWICIDEILNGDHDALKFYGDSAVEALNRQEVYAVMQLLEAAVDGTGGTSNDFAPETGESTLTYPVLVAMVRSLAKYGNKFVLYTGANVTTDVYLMDFNANTFRKYGLENLNITHKPIEDLQVIISGVTKTVLDPDVAFLVATSDADNRKPIVMARRKLSGGQLSAPDTTVQTAKERIILDTGNVRPMGDDGRLFSRGKAMFQSYGLVLLNELTVAKFEK